MYFVASRSLLAICDHKINDPESESQKIPLTYPSKKGETVYCHPTALKNFVLDYLPNIKFPFILVSGDSDIEVPTDIPIESQIILQHPLLLSWYSQNCVSDKIHKLPIGLDFHTLMSKQKHTWGPQQSINQQENDLVNLSNYTLPRIPKCYGNFHFLMNSRYGKDRIEAYSQIPHSLVFYEPVKTQRINCWKNMVKFKYVISPHGNGLDCHRTWEALALGCIPIMKTSSLDLLFDGLPVLIVSDWSKITQKLLTDFKPSINLEKLQLSYWKRCFET